jgi:Flp pilus assembly protein TadG
MDMQNIRRNSTMKTGQRGRKMRRDEHGGSLVEFAIVMPLLFILLFGIIDFGILLYNQAVITNASREGARYGIVARSPRRTPEEITTFIRSFCDSNLLKTFGTWTDPTVAPNHDEGQDFGDPLSVQVQWQHRFLALPNLPGVGLTNPITLSAHTVMNYE